MSLLIPLGLLSLISIAVLILIYIIKPNYQQKYVSSTFVWKLSMKYKKKKIPISKLRNLLLILCQIAILAACALIIAKPVQVLKEKIDCPEVIAIIDSSASMRVQSDDESRFERAVNMVEELSESVFSRGGIMSVIVSDGNPEFLQTQTEDGNVEFTAQRTTQEKRVNLISALQVLTSENTACSFGSSDMEQTMALCSEIVDVNPEAQIYYYTDANYSYVPDGITVVNVAQEQEWNASIINAYSDVRDNHYVFYVEVACYGRNMDLQVDLQIQGANTEDSSEQVALVNYTGSALCEGDKTQTIIFSDRKWEDLEDYEKNAENIYFVTLQSPITSFRSVHVSIDVNDSFFEDNDFDIYDGQKEVIKVQYASSLTNAFVNGALSVIQSHYADRWDMRISEIRDGNYATEGFDVYIFEHSIPEVLPLDGVVLLINPNRMPIGSGLIIGETKSFSQETYFTKGSDHAIMNNIKPEKIFVSALRSIPSYSEDYQVLMWCGDYPVALVKDTPQEKVVVLSFSLNYSNMAMRTDFPLFIYNMFENFVPPTVVGNSFEVNESVKVQSRGEDLTVTFNGKVINKFTSFPSVLNLSQTGTYILSQTTFGGKVVKNEIYVRIPESECNIKQDKDSLSNPYSVQRESDYYNDLLLYFAIALVSLLFIEWLLQLRETM